jgi:hypothetical protein
MAARAMADGIWKPYPLGLGCHLSDFVPGMSAAFHLLDDSGFKDTAYGSLCLVPTHAGVFFDCVD